jgi:hypothetical protein
MSLQKHIGDSIIPRAENQQSDDIYHFKELYPKPDNPNSFVD